MKTVGKQLQEARQSRNWTPELAARETKIKVERLRDLEADDYTHFSSPAYARGFLRTYARSLGLDEYKILRQLDNKLPEDDNSSFVPDSGLPYMPEPHSDSHIRSNKTGLYVVLGLGGAVMLVIAFVLFEAYRAGELQNIFADNTTSDTLAPTAATNTPPVKADASSETRALPADPNAPVPPAVDLPATNSVAATDTNAAPSMAAAPANTNGDVPPQAMKAIPVDASQVTNSPPLATVGTDSTSNTGAKTPLRALPVDLNAATDPTAAGAVPAIPLSPGATNAPPPTMAHDAASLAAAAMSSKGHIAPMAPVPTPIPAATNGAPLAQVLNAPTPDKHLILTASRDSFVRVTAVDAPDLEQVRYASVLHAGQSVGFDGRKFSVNVGIPSAVDITLDGVNYGPHSDQEAPETFTVESHQQ